MHEWALAEAVVAAAAGTAARERLRRVSLLRVRVGELQRIDREILEKALKEILRQEKPPLQETRTHLETEKAMFRCRACRREWRLEPPPRGADREEWEAIHFLPEMVFVHLRCPGCSGPDFEILKGRGIWLDTVEGER